MSHDDLLYRLLADARPAALPRALAEQLLNRRGEPDRVGRGPVLVGHTFAPTSLDRPSRPCSPTVTERLSEPERTPILAILATLDIGQGEWKRQAPPMEIESSTGNPGAPSTGCAPLFSNGSRPATTAAAGTVASAISHPRIRKPTPQRTPDHQPNLSTETKEAHHVCSNVLHRSSSDRTRRSADRRCSHGCGHDLRRSGNA